MCSLLDARFSFCCDFIVDGLGLSRNSDVLNWLLKTLSMIPDCFEYAALA